MSRTQYSVTGKKPGMRSQTVMGRQTIMGVPLSPKTLR